MNISDTLYELAFEYKKTGLWKKLWDREMFAVKLSDGEIAYVAVMGRAGTYCALGAYIGDEGFHSYKTIAAFTPDEEKSYLQQHEIMISQKALQMALEQKDDLEENEVREVRDFAKRKGRRICGKNAWPHFIKYEPSHYPWHFQTDQEKQYMEEVLQAALQVARWLETEKPQDLGIAEITDFSTEILLLEKVNGVYERSGFTPLPREKRQAPVRPGKLNELGIRRLQKFKKSGLWDCELIQIIEPIQDEPDQMPYYPYMLMTVEENTYFALPPSAVKDYREEPESVVNAFIEELIHQKIRPEAIRVRDERTFALLEDLAKMLHVPISMVEEMDAMDDLEEGFVRHMGRDAVDEIDEIAEMLQEILQMKDSEIRSIPQELVDQLYGIIEAGVLPKDLCDALIRKLSRR